MTEKQDHTHLLNKESLGFPFFIVLAYLFVEYARPQDWFPVVRGIKPGMIVSGAAILALLIYRPQLPQIAKYVLLFLGIMLISIPFAENNYYAYQYTRNFALLVFGGVLPLMAFTDSYNKFIKIIWFWVIIHIPLAAYGILHHGRGVGSFLGDENDFCLVMNMIIPYVIFLLFVSKTQFKKIFLIGCVLLFLGAIVASNSRGGFVGLVAIFFIMWIIMPRKITSSILIIMLVITLLLITPEAYWAEIETIGTAHQDTDTGGVRLYYWSLAWEMFKDNPIFGVGAGNYPFNTLEYETFEMQSRGRHVWGRVSHSLYFTLLPELGIIGTILFFVIAYKGYRERKKIRKQYIKTIKQKLEMSDNITLKTIYFLTFAIDTSLVAYLVTGAFVSVLYYPHFWILTAFSAVISTIFYKEVDKYSAVNIDKNMSLEEQKNL